MNKIGLFFALIAVVLCFSSCSNTADGDAGNYDCNIIYDLNGGNFSGDTPNKFLSENGFELNEKPTRNGYKFYAWIDKKSGECVDKIKILPGKSDDYEFYAIWYTDIDDNGYVLSKKEDGYAVVWYCGEIKKDLRMSAEYNGTEITEIDKYAFYYRKDLNDLRLVLPISINKIGSYAFEKATGLCIYLSDYKKLDTWLSELSTDDTNQQAIEVIKGERAAIGWSKWVK